MQEPIVSCFKSGCRKICDNLIQYIQKLHEFEKEGNRVLCIFSRNYLEVSELNSIFANVKTEY